MSRKQYFLLYTLVQLNRSIFWNGKIEQWKYIASVSGETANIKTVTFAIAFTIATPTVIVIEGGAVDSASLFSEAGYDFNETSFKCRFVVSQKGTLRYYAIGY